MICHNLQLHALKICIHVAAVRRVSSFYGVLLIMTSDAVIECVAQLNGYHLKVWNIMMQENVVCQLIRRAAAWHCKKTNNWVLTLTLEIPAEDKWTYCIRLPFDIQGPGSVPCVGGVLKDQYSQTMFSILYTNWNKTKKKSQKNLTPCAANSDKTVDPILHREPSHFVKFVAMQRAIFNIQKGLAYLNLGLISDSKG
jgi:hypothetical protein